MNTDKILELARRYTYPDVREEQTFEFSQDDLIAFAQSVINAEQTVTLIQERLAEDDDEPVAWMADDLNNENLYYDKQDAIDDGCAFIVPLYRRPQPKARLTDEEIFDLEWEH